MTRKQFVFGATVICMAWLPYLIGADEVDNISNFDAIRCKTLIVDDWIQTKEMHSTETIKCGKADAKGNIQTESFFIVDVNGNIYDEPRIAFTNKDKDTGTSWTLASFRIEKDGDFLFLNSKPPAILMKDQTHSRLMTTTTFQTEKNEDIK